MVVKMFSKRRGGIFVEKSLPSIRNVCSWESRIWDYSWSWSSLNFEKSKANFSKMDVSHKHNSTKS